MSDWCKRFVFMLLFMIVLGVLMVDPCTAPVTVPDNPSAAPEIVSVVVNHNPIWYPPTYTTNPYTGEVTEKYPGRYLYNGSVDVTIKNRPFTPYTDKDGNYINVYYTFFIKDGGSVDDWTYYLTDFGGNHRLPWHIVYQQSDSDYTVITFTYDVSGSIAPGSFLVMELESVRRFRVQSVVGYFYRDEYPYYNSVYEGEGSDWTQFTVTIPDSDKPVTSKPTINPTTNTPSTSNPSYTNPPQKPYQTYLTVIILTAVFLITITITILAYRYGQRKSKPTQTNSTIL